MALEILRILVALLIGAVLWTGCLGIILSLGTGTFWATIPAAILTVVALAAAVVMHEYNHRVVPDDEGRETAVRER